MKLQGMKMLDMKMLLGHEHDGPKMTAKREIAAEKKYSFNRDNIYNEMCKFLNPQHCP